MKRFLFFGLALGLFLGSVRADETVRALQERLKQAGFYHGKLNGSYDTETASAVTRYQIRSGLAISGKMDAATLKALHVPPPAAVSATPEPPPEPGTWRRLRNGDMQYLEKLNAGEIAPPKPPSTPAKEPAAPVAKKRADAPPASRPTVPSKPQIRVSSTPSPRPADAAEGKERLRDYVGAFVLAGLDPQVGAELEFFADRVKYYGERNVSRAKIRRDLVRYDQRWPERRFGLAGVLAVRRAPGGLLRVTFPLRYELRNGRKSASGKVRKTITLRRTGDGNLEIVGVEEE
jgi:peptidoglycan hydrolase-like protein with peptidoglycan-binding domain